MHTLEQDILRIWKEHGLEVTEETVKTDAKDITVWTIKAKRNPSYVPKVSS